MKPTVALISIALLGGCATREGGVGSTIAGGAAIGVGALLIATDNSPACMDPPHCPFVAPVREIGEGGLLLTGTVLVIAGLVGIASHDWEREQQPVPAGAPAIGLDGYPIHPQPGATQVPLNVDANKRDTERDRLALQASYAARRGDCAGTQAAMKRLAAIDASLRDRLAHDDASIVRCVRD